MNVKNAIFCNINHYRKLEKEIKNYDYNFETLWKYFKKHIMDNNRTKDKTMASNFSLEFDDFSFFYEQENLVDINIDSDSSFSCTSEPDNTVVNNSDKSASQDNSPSSRFVGITEDEKSAFLRPKKCEYNKKN